MQIRGAEPDDLLDIAELAAESQADPAQAIVYLGTDATTIATELAELDWRSVSGLAVDGARLLGWLIGDADPKLGRVYWLGPFIAEPGRPDGEWNDIASQLYADCLPLLPAGMSEEEIAIDARFGRCRAWAIEHEFMPNPRSLELVLEDDLADPSLAPRHVVAGDLEVVGALHERLFPGTHATGRQLVEEGDRDHVRLVTEIDGLPAGYVAFELQPDGAGYIDFLGVDEDYRRSGLAAELVRAAVAALRRRGAALVHLTVREDNVAARNLGGFNRWMQHRVVRGSVGGR